ncbi:hypothetical protein GCM10009624_36200 [Gordonia sinesedis]
MFSVRSAVSVCGAVVIGAGLVAGCSSDSDDSASQSSAAPSAGKNADGVANDPKVRSDVSMTGCNNENGEWTASGSVRNPTDRLSIYTVTVSFVDQNSSVIRRGSTLVTVDGGKTEKFEVKTKVADKGLRCVLRGVDRKQ